MEWIDLISNWVNSKASLLALIATFILAIITLIYTIITRKILMLSSQPTIKIEPNAIRISPDIKHDIKSELENSNIDSILDDKKRYSIYLDVTLNNIGNNPAQNIYIDSHVFFKKRRQFGKNTLPIHLPEFISFIPPFTENNEKSQIKITLAYDGFLAKEIIKDFFGSRNNYGFPWLSFSNEMKSSILWPSPRIKIKCFYSDIQNRHYCSEHSLFFHIFWDPDIRKLGIYLLRNLEELSFFGIENISRISIRKHFKKQRSLRYTSFYGQKFKRNELILLMRAKQEKKSDLGDVDSNK
ncbi:MAG: hypothetical protein PHE84_00270 [bacterium]|nr:hypothetical protein [bacterium]